MYSGMALHSALRCASTSDAAVQVDLAAPRAASTCTDQADVNKGLVHMEYACQIGRVLNQLAFTSCTLHLQA